MIRAVLFDGDNTLWDFQSAMRRGLRTVLDVIRSEHPDDAAAADLGIERMIEIRDQVGIELADRVLAMDVIRLAAFERTLEEIGLVETDLSVRLDAIYDRTRRDATELFPETRSVLSRLQERFTLGLVTNGSTQPTEVGLEDLLDIAMLGPEIGIAKPDPAIFKEAASRAGVDSTECVVVGDSPETDILGAKRSGMFGVWLDRTNTGRSFGDATISTLTDLPGVIDVLNGVE